MMHIMDLGIIDGVTKDRQHNIVSRMIPSCQDSSDSQKEDYRQKMNSKLHDMTTKVQRPKMIVFTQDVFDRMNVDSIFIGTAGCLLCVMVFVDVTVDGFDMECPM